MALKIIPIRTALPNQRIVIANCSSVLPPEFASLGGARFVRVAAGFAARCHPRGCCPALSSSSPVIPGIGAAAGEPQVVRSRDTDIFIATPNQHRSQAVTSWLTLADPPPLALCNSLKAMKIACPVSAKIFSALDLQVVDCNQEIYAEWPA
jgi:hypothetical protein